jgi:hypothetical protein
MSPFIMGFEAVVSPPAIYETSGKPTREQNQRAVIWEVLGQIHDLPICSPIACSSLEADGRISVAP